jgi:hypothetical protein
MLDRHNVPNAEIIGVAVARSSEFVARPRSWESNIYFTLEESAGRRPACTNS